MGEQERNEQEFDFIKEKIKSKPVNKRRLLLYLCGYVFAAVLFGVIVCVTFVALQPHITSWLYPDDSSITIPMDDMPDASEGEQESEKLEEEPVQEPQNQTVYVQEQLDVQGYQELQKQLYAIGKQANKAVVTVTGVTSGVDWFNTTYESENQASGVIIANNGQEFLILTEKKVITDAQSINITFIDGQTVPATLRKYHGNTGIAIVSVPITSVSENTMNQIAVATLGNSLVLGQGTTVLAIGSPLGTNYSILCGTITSAQNKVTTIDNNYTVFTTDMVGSENGSGLLINLSGEVVGILMQDYNNAGSRNTITAFSISELKKVIEDLSNNQDIPYAGLKISTVTNAIAERYGLPKGVYIKEVIMDSPAMAAGLQVADVIVKMNGNYVESAEQYNEKLMQLHPGDTVTFTVKRQNGEEYIELECATVVGVLQ